MTEKTKEILDRINAYRGLVRVKYANMEKLSRLNILNKYYNTSTQKPSEEKLKASINSAESLSGKMILPLKVKGVFLTEGRPAMKYYTADELEKSTYNPINQSFPLMLDHDDNKAEKVIGKVTKIKYDKSIKGIRWWGHINSELYARNVADGAIKEVSVTVFSTAVNDEILGLKGIDLTYKELSLVISGAEPNNFIQADNGDDKW